MIHRQHPPRAVDVGPFDDLELQRSDGSQIGGDYLYYPQARYWI